MAESTGEQEHFQHFRTNGQKFERIGVTFNAGRPEQAFFNGLDAVDKNLLCAGMPCGHPLLDRAHRYGVRSGYVPPDSAEALRL